MSETQNYNKTAFSGETTKKVSLLPFEQLACGWHKVVVMMVIFTSDFYKGLRNPVRKAENELPPWEDETNQLAVYFEGENRKGATRRFTRWGYWKYDELLKVNPDEAATCEKMGDQGYAVDKVDHVRLIDNTENGATQKALAILSRFTKAAGIPEDTPLDQLDTVLLKKELMIEVGARTYKGKTYLDVVNFANVDMPAEELKRIPKPEGVMDHIPATDAAAAEPVTA